MHAQHTSVDLGALGPAACAGECLLGPDDEALGRGKKGRTGKMGAATDGQRPAAAPSQPEAEANEPCLHHAGSTPVIRVASASEVVVNVQAVEVSSSWYTIPAEIGRAPCREKE